MATKREIAEKALEELMEIQDHNEYNQFLCDEIRFLVRHLNMEGLRSFRKTVKGIRESMKK
jgi:hypothetical protein